MIAHFAPALGVLACAGFLWGCSNRNDGTPPTPPSPTTAAVEICPGIGEGGEATRRIIASGGRLRLSRPPTMSASAGGASVQLMGGTSTWCGLHGDAFQVITGDTPLVVAAGEMVTIPNPLPGEHLYAASVNVHDAGAIPTPGAGHLVWPFSPGGRGDSGLSYDDTSIRFAAPAQLGRHVVGVWVSFEKVADMFTSSNREAYYALLIDVRN